MKESDGKLVESLQERISRRFFAGMVSIIFAFAFSMEKLGYLIQRLITGSLGCLMYTI